MHTPWTWPKAKRGGSGYRWAEMGEWRGKIPILKLIWHSNIQVSWGLGKTNG